MSEINFNSNQFTPLSEEVQEAMKEAILEFSVAKIEGFGRDYKIQATIDETKDDIAAQFNTNANELFFLYGNEPSELEIINWSILILGVRKIISSPFENNFKLDYLKGLENRGQIELKLVKTSEFGEIDLNDFNKSFNNAKKSLITLSHVNSYTGILLPLKEVFLIAKEYNSVFHLNAGLTAGKYDIDLNKVRPDFMSFDTSLLNGPTAIGCIFLNAGLVSENETYNLLKKAIRKTENKNIVSILGAKVALINALETMNQNRQKVKGLRDYFIDELEVKLKIHTINKQLRKDCIYNSIAFFVEQRAYGKYFFEQLDLRNFTLPRLEYPQFGKCAENKYFINISLSKNCTKNEIDDFIRTIQQMAKN